MKRFGELFGWRPKKEESKKALPPATAINIDNIPLEILQQILDQLDLVSIFRLQRSNKQLSKNIQQIPTGRISSNKQTHTYLTLRQNPEYRPNIFFGELYNRSEQFAELKLSITKALSVVNESQQQSSSSPSLSAENLALLLCNMQVYFENNPVNFAYWKLFENVLLKLIQNIFSPLQEKLKEKNLFWFIMSVIHEQLRMTYAARGALFDNFIDSLQKFLKFFKEHSFSIDKLSPKEFHTFITQNVRGNIYEELCLILSGINDFLNLDLFNYFVTFLTENKKLTNMLRAHVDGLQVYQNLLPLFLRYNNPEKEVTEIKEVAKLCKRFINPKSISDTMVLSNSLALISAADGFPVNSRQQNHNLLQLLLELLSKSTEKESSKREKWFSTASQGLLVFITAKTVIKSEYIQFLFTTAKVHSDVFRLAEAMQIAIDNEEKFVTTKDIQTWVGTLPTQLPVKYTEFSGVNYLIYLLTKAIHALGLVGALEDKEEVKSQLINTVIIKANIYVTIYGAIFQLLEFLGQFYDEKVTAKEAGVFLLDVIKNQDHLSVEFLSSELVSLMCKFIKGNLISSDISYNQFIDVLLTARDIDTSECLKIMLEDRTVLTKNFLNDLEKIFKFRQTNALVILRVLICYQYFKPEGTLENILQLLAGPIKHENFSFIQALQVLRKFCEDTKEILSNENKDALFLSLIKSIKDDEAFAGFSKFEYFLKFLLKFKGYEIFNTLIEIFVSFNLSVKVTNAAELFHFDSCCATLYTTKIITGEFLWQLLAVATKDFNLANTFALCLLNEEDARQEICQQLAKKCDEMGLVVPAAIREASEAKKLEQASNLKDEDEVYFEIQFSPQP